MKASQGKGKSAKYYMLAALKLLGTIETSHSLRILRRGHWEIAHANHMEERSTVRYANIVITWLNIQLIPSKCNLSMWLLYWIYRRISLYPNLSITSFRVESTINCNKFENSREVIFSKLVRVLDRQIFWLVRIQKRKRRITRTTWVWLSQEDGGQT